MQLLHAHDYHLQMHGQTNISNRKYCDFVCWTPVGMYIEQVKVDKGIFDGIKLLLESFSEMYY